MIVLKAACKISRRCAFINDFQKFFQSEANKTFTLNNAPAYKSTTSFVLNLFYHGGAYRNHSEADAVDLFTKAYNENQDLALRTLFLIRDIRGGYGERRFFRSVLQMMASDPRFNNELFGRIVAKVGELGRFDDLTDLEWPDKKKQVIVYNYLKEQLDAGNALCAKWFPRKGEFIGSFRTWFKITPKELRKRLVKLNSGKLVETLVTEGRFSEINYSHVPSRAMKLYQKTFAEKDTERFNEWKASLLKPESKAKVNVGTLYPYEIVFGEYESEMLRETSWAELIKKFGDSIEISILPMVDVSGSMMTRIAGTNTMMLQVAVAMGMYFSSVANEETRHCLLSFTDIPKLFYLDPKMPLRQQAQAMMEHVGYNTDIELAFKVLLDKATKEKWPKEVMPGAILMLSDMQFDCNEIRNKPNHKNIKKLFEKAGYNVPVLVYWNLNSYDNVPLKQGEDNTILISGFNPSMLKQVMSGSMPDPYQSMLEAIMDSRYDY